jgi:hypothetical protein
MREQIGDINPELERVMDNLNLIQASVDASQSRMPVAIQNVRVALIVVAVLVFLTQIPSAYTGYRMVVGDTKLSETDPEAVIMPGDGTASDAEDSQ